MIFSKLKNFILKRAGKSSLARRISCLLVGDEVFWDFGARTEKAAMHITINTQEPELFDKQGMQLAGGLKAKINPDSIILDFGCGIGRPERFLAPYCKEIHGVDISRGMIRLARKRHKGIKNVYFHKNNGTDLSMFQECTFDFAFSEAVFKHMDKERTVLLFMEIYRALKRNGIVFLQFCNLLSPYNLNSFINQSKHKILMPTRMRYWLPEETKAVTQAIGFKKISMEIKSHFRDKHREFLVDDYHRGHSIWVLASKG